MRAFGAHTLKTAPGSPLMRDEVGSHLFVDAVVAALVEEVEVLVGEELGSGEGGVGGHERAELGARLSLPERGTFLADLWRVVCTDGKILPSPGTPS